MNRLAVAGLSLVLFLSATFLAVAVPNRWELERDLAFSLEETGGYQEAFQILLKLERSGVDDPDVLLGLARNAVQTGQAGEVRSIHHRIKLATGADDASAVETLASLTVQLKLKTEYPSMLVLLEKHRGRMDSLKLMLRMNEALGRHDVSVTLVDEGLRQWPDDVDFVLAKARALATLQKYEELTRFLTPWETTMVSEDEYRDILEFQSLAFRKLGRPDEARRRLALLLELKPEDRDLLLLSAEVETSAGFHEQALALYDRLIRLDPNNLIARQDRIASLRRLGREEQAIDAYISLLNLDPDNMEVRRSLAWTLLDQKRTTEAYEIARRLPRGRAATNDDLGLLVSVLLAMKKHREAVPLIQELTRRTPDRKNLKLLTEGLLILDRKREAMATLEKLLRGSPDAETLQLLAETQLALGEHDRALKTLARLSRLRPNANVLLLRAETLVALKRHREALPLVKQLVSRDPSAANWRLLGDILLELGRLEEAASLFSRIVERSPDAENYMLLADTLIALKRPGQALPALKHLIVRDPSTKNWRLLGDTLLEVGYKQDAVRVLQRVADEAPEATLYQTLAYTRLELSQNEAALQSARSWLALNRKNADAAALMATILFRLNDRDEARTMLGVAIELEKDPVKRIQHQLDLFYSLADGGLHQEAIDTGLPVLASLEEGSLTRPDSLEPDLRRSLSSLLAETGRVPEAVELYRPLIARETASREEKLEFAELLWRAGEKKESEALLVALLPAETEHGPAHIRLLDIWSSRREDWPRATSMALEMRYGARSKPEVLRALVRAWIGMGRPPEARELLSPLWETIGDQPLWVRDLTADYLVSASRWREALTSLAQIPLAPQTDRVDRKVRIAEAQLGAPSWLWGRARGTLKSTDRSTLQTRPAVTRQLDQLRKTAHGTHFEVTSGYRSATDGLTSFEPRISVRRTLNEKDHLRADIRRVDMERDGVSAKGEVAGVEFSRRLSADAAIFGGLETTRGLPADRSVVARAGVQGVANEQGDPFRVSVGRDYISESPQAWQQGLTGRSLKMSHERPRDGNSLSSSASALVEQIDDGVSRYSLEAAVRKRANHRFDYGLSLGRRDAQGAPNPTNLYFAPKDFWSVDADASWMAASLGSWGDWSVRAGLHFDWLQGEGAQGNVAGIRAEFPMGPVDGLILEWNRFTNSANRVSDQADGYTERSLNLFYTTRN